MKRPRAYVLDSWAVLAYLEGEPAAAKIADLLADAHEARAPLLMSVVNAGEVWYIVARRTDADEADRIVGMLQDIGVRFVDADWRLTKIAAQFKVRGNISYADSYAAALAKQNKAHLLTGDEEFRPFEDQLKIFWL